MAPTNPKSTTDIVDLLIPFAFGAIPVLSGLLYDALHQKKPQAGGASNGARISPDRRAGRRSKRMENPIDSPKAEDYLRNKITPYEHIPLRSDQHIRVIELHPSTSEQAVLHCSILQMDLDRIDDCGIEAISYCWGPHVEPENDLYCHNATSGSPAPSVFKIGTSLHSALVRFRHKYEYRCVWADAVCIDQDNNPEKSKQVRHMAKIYASASRTLIWLGKGNNSDEKCVEFFKQLDATLPASATREGTIKNAIKQTFRNEGYEPLARFFNPESWFMRRWIIQEAAKSTEAVIYCGASFISWRTFAAGVELLNRHSPRDMLVSGINTDILTTIGYINILWENKSTAFGILDLLTVFHLSECEDARDRIYALLNLTDSKKYIVPDYSKSHEVIYKEFAIKLPHRDHLQLLHCGPAFQPEGKSALSGWTSWIPYWSQELTFNPLFNTGNFKAGGALAPNMTVNKRTLELTITGKVLNDPMDGLIVITSINDPVPKPKALETVHNWIENWIPNFSHDEPHQIDWREFAITLVAGLSSDLYMQSRADSFGRRFEGMQQRQTREDHELAFLELSQYKEKMKDFVSVRRGLPLRDMVKYSPRARKYAKQLYSTMKGRCFFEVVKGQEIYIGIGPAGMEEGDTIAIFHGAQTPFILRQYKQTERFNLIGDCYIHRLMHGEAFGLGLRDETFVLV